MFYNIYSDLLNLESLGEKYACGPVHVCACMYSYIYHDEPLFSFYYYMSVFYGKSPEEVFWIIPIFWLLFSPEKALSTKTVEIIKKKCTP